MHPLTDEYLQILNDLTEENPGKTWQDRWGRAMSKMVYRPWLV